jgi:hypothetical protein
MVRYCYWQKFDFQLTLTIFFENQFALLVVFILPPAPIFTTLSCIRERKNMNATARRDKDWEAR